jgi:hypothetical protein
MAITIDIENLTNNDAVNDGTATAADDLGVFEELMNSMNLYLKDQYSRDRLKGTDYANVLLGMGQSIIAQSMEFVLRKDAIEADIRIKEKELEIKASQLALVERQIAEIEARIKGMGFDNALKEKELEVKDQQILISKKDVAIKERSIAKIEADIALTYKQIAIADKDIDLKVRQAVKISKDTEAVDAQIEIAQAEVILKERQSEVMKKDIEVKDKQVTKIDTDIKAMSTQIELSEQEVAMKEQQYSQSADKHGINLSMIRNQKEMSDIDLKYKARNAETDLMMKHNQSEQILADVSFTESKKDIMEATRKDNVRMKSAEQFAEFLKYISAANVVPAEEDFDNMRKLILSIALGVGSSNVGATEYSGLIKLDMDKNDDTAPTLVDASESASVEARTYHISYPNGKPITTNDYAWEAHDYYAYEDITDVGRLIKPYNQSTRELSTGE